MLGSRVAGLLEIEDLQRYRAPMVCEGRAIRSDGAGTLLVTEQCLLNPNRNPTLGKQRIENLLKAYTGARTVIWLGAGVWADETSGHIDNLACFVAPGCVLLAYEENRRDPMHRISHDAYERLLAAAGCTR
jgi:agmatine deiminase